jgi:hypothetical protein
MRYKIGAEQLEVVPAMVHGAERPGRQGGSCPRWLARWLPVSPCHAGEPRPR